MRRRSCCTLVLAAGLAAPSASAAAQEGPFVPIGSRVDRVVVWALDAGALPSLDPLTRPWRLGAVRAALARADTIAGSRAAAAVRWAADAIHAAADSQLVVIEVAASAYRHGGRDPYRAAGPSGAALAGGIRAYVVRGPLLATLSPAVDNSLRDDPSFTGYRGSEVVGRMQEAYVAVVGADADLSIGRMARNWGPLAFEGLLLSPSAYSGDQLAGSLRAGRFELTSLAQRLDDRDTLAAVPYRRWFLAHRLTVRLGRHAWLSAYETGVYGGPGQGFDPAMHAPLNLALLSQFNEGQNLNAMLGADLSLPVPGRGRFDLSAFLDDIQVDDSALTDQRPTSYGLTVAWVFPVAASPIHLTVGYTRVSSLAYRNSFDPQLIYAIRDVGMGRNASDYDQALLRVAWRSSPWWEVAAEVSHLRQGNYDFRQPFPDDSTLARPGQGFLVSPVRRATGGRIAFLGEVRPGVEARVELVGVRTLAGVTEGSARAGLRLRYDVLARRPGGSLPALDGAR